MSDFIKFSRIFSRILINNDIAELCKGAHCVDLGESFQRHIFLQNFASTQPRTSPLKFAASRDVPFTVFGFVHRRGPLGGSGHEAERCGAGGLRHRAAEHFLWRWRCGADGVRRSLAQRLPVPGRSSAVALSFPECKFLKGIRNIASVLRNISRRRH